MLTNLEQARAMVRVAALAAPPEEPDERGWHEYLAQLAVWQLIDDPFLRETWGALTGAGKGAMTGDELYPCPGCKSTCHLHQPGCDEMSPALLEWERYQASLCHAPTSNYGPAEDPYGSSCDKPNAHSWAVLDDGSPDMAARKHEGPDALGGGRVQWYGGGTCPGSGDDLGMRDFHMILGTFCTQCGAITSDGPDGNDLCNECINSQHAGRT